MLTDQPVAVPRAPFQTPLIARSLCPWQLLPRWNRQRPLYLWDLACRQYTKNRTSSDETSSIEGYFNNSQLLDNSTLYIWQ